MAGSEDLFKLIKSMTKTERRHFTLSTSLYEKEKLYMKLFQLIDSQEVYNESAIREKFHVSQFSVAKTRLFQMITSSLATFQSERNVDRYIRECIEQAEVLHNKNFLAAAIKLYEKARIKAFKTGRYECALEIIRLYPRKGISHEQIEILQQSESELIFRIEKISALKHLCSKFELLFQTKGFANTTEEYEEYASLIRNDATLIDQQDFDQEYTYYYNVLHAWFYFAIKEPERAHEFLLKILFYLNEDQLYLNDKLWNERRGDILMFYYRTCVYCRREVELEFVRREFVSHEFSTYQLDQLFTIQMEDMLLLEQAEVDTSLIQKIELHVEQKSEEEEFDFNYFSLVYSLANYYFVHQDYKKSLKHCNRFLNNKSAQSIFLFHAVVQLYILSHYNLNNIDLVLSELKSYNRKMSHNKEIYNVQFLFIGMLRELTGFSDNKSKILLEYKEKTEQMIIRNRSINIFDFTLLSWIESKLNEKTVRDYFKSHQTLERLMPVN